MTAAEFICYVQPVTAKCEEAGAAWVDTTKTAVLRRTVASKAEAAALVGEARAMAQAMGGEWAIKKLARAIPGARRPAGVKAMQGVEAVR